ncbi:MAG: hypothetical protein LC128_06000 [Chitinophagales bacterium]|nr:hypothetical protein [Chitinophagales bacterium]
MADVVNRDTLEALLARTISKELRGELSKLMDLLGDPPSIYNVPPTFWQNSGAALQASIEPILRDIYLEQASAQLVETSIGVDWALINENAVTWTSQYTFDLVRGINETSQRLLRNSIDAYFRNPTTIGDLQRSLSGVFSPMRAEMIAVTEVTRAAAEGEQRVVDQIIADNPGMESIDIWMTNRDDITCPICGERHQQPRGSNWTENPPAHPRCRCWLRHDFRRKQTVDSFDFDITQYINNQDYIDAYNESNFNPSEKRAIKNVLDRAKSENIQVDGIYTFSFGEADKNTFAYVSGDNRAIRINKDLMGKYNDLFTENYNNRNQASRNFEEALTHELGHLWTFDKNINAQLAQRVFEYNARFMPGTISKYATHSVEEMIAECYTVARNSISGRDVNLATSILNQLLGGN